MLSLKPHLKLKTVKYGLMSYLNQSEYKGEKFKHRVAEPEEFYLTLDKFTSNPKPQTSNLKL